MNGVKIWFAVLLLVTSSIFSIIIGVMPSEAQGSVSIDIINSDGRVTKYIRSGEWFTVNIDVDTSVYPQTQNGTVVVNVTNDIDGSVVYSTTVQLDKFGVGSTNIRITDVGNYTINVVHGSKVIGSAPLVVYIPIPSTEYSKIITKDSSGNIIEYFSPGDFIEIDVIVRDQHNNPMGNIWFSSGEQIYVEVKRGNVSLMSWYGLPNITGVYTVYYTPTQYGDYQIYAYDIYQQQLHNITSGVFHVISLRIRVVPDYATYPQGMTIKIVVETDIKGEFTVNITDESGKAIGKGQWENVTAINGTWSTEYTLWDSLPDGNYNINVVRGGHILGTKTIILKKYSLHISLNKRAYLPGENLRCEYVVVNNLDGSPVVTNVSFMISGTQIMDSAERSSGAFTPRLPTTLSYGYYQINLWANDTKYHTSYASSYIYLGPISAYVYTDKSSYVIGEPCIVHVHAYVSGYYTDGAVNNASVVVSLVDSNGNVLNRSGMLKTDRNGDCTFVFSLSNLEEGTYTISTNVSYPRNKAEYVVVNDTINVREYMGMEVYVSTDKSQYCCGEEMKVYYVAYSNGTVVRSNATYIIYNPNVIEGYGVLAMGLDSSGEITYTIPDDYSGEIRVRVEVSDGRGGFVSKEATAYVVQGRVVVNADKTYYQAGDHVVFRYEVVGLENYSVLYSLVCDDEEVKRGMATDSEIPWDVPTDAAPERCTLYVYAYSNGRMVGGQCTVCRQNYRLFIWVDKRTYKPGSVINLHYRIERTEGAPEIAFPTTLTVTLNSGMSETYTISSYDGVVSYHVPANMPDGRYVIGASITGADNVGVYAQSVIEVKKGVNWFLVAIILLFILVIISLLQSFGILKNLERIKGRLPHIPRKRKPTFGRRISRLGRRYYTPPREWQPPEELEEMEESEQEI